MIVGQEGKHIEIQFGNGDVNILSGCFDECETNFKVGFVGYRNQEPREVGSKGDDSSNIESLSDMPIVMTFHKIECIDVLIKALNGARDNMK